MSSGQNAWALKSKAALLVALLIKRQGATLWDAALPQLAILAQQGAPQAEAVRPSRPHRQCYALPDWYREMRSVLWGKLFGPRACALPSRPYTCTCPHCIIFPHW